MNNNYSATHKDTLALCNFRTGCYDTIIMHSKMCIMYDNAQLCLLLECTIKS